jgi:hypothetical protein
VQAPRRAGTRERRLRLVPGRVKKRPTPFSGNPTRRQAGRCRACAGKETVGPPGGTVRRPRTSAICGASTAQASPIWSRRNRLNRGSARSARQPGLLPISAPQARAHRANHVGAAPCRLGADDGPLISFPFPVLQSRSQSGSLQASVTGSLLPSTQESRRGDEGPGQLPVGRASGSGPETPFGGSGSCHVAKALPKTRLRVRMHSGP